MMHHVTANYTPTAMLNPAASTGLRRASASGATGTPAAGNNVNSATTGIGSTFLSLLVQELQNQDPTSPMDSTAMVGQMISLNQLDQLISINQAVGGNPGTLGTGASTAGGAAAAPGGATPTGGMVAAPAAAELSGTQAAAAAPPLPSAHSLSSPYPRSAESFR